MSGTPLPGSISTRLRRIANLAREDRDRSFLSLAQHIDIHFLHAAYARVRKSGAPGIDGTTAADYAENLEENLRCLLDRFKSGRYRAPPVRRVRIPKGDGKQTRPLGIPTFEDKILQTAVTMVLEAIYEEDFLDCSYGFRRGRSAHQALGTLRQGLISMEGGWVLEVDIQRFFDELDHDHLRAFLRQRVRDGVLHRTIGKWLKAGVMEEGFWSRSATGTPQGGVISPLLANVYLHEVVDRWFDEEVRPRLRGRGLLVRYCDDFIMAFATKSDAERVKAALSKRLERFGLRLHPTKTRLVRFYHPWRDDPPGGRGKRGTFDFLGFTHHWKRTPRGGWALMTRTAKNRSQRFLKRINVFCRRNRHEPLPWQQSQLALRLRGFYGYFGLPGNHRSVTQVHRQVERLWQKWLNRRSQEGTMRWARFKLLLKRYPLPPPRTMASHRT